MSTALPRLRAPRPLRFRPPTAELPADTLLAAPAPDWNPSDSWNRLTPCNLTERELLTWLNQAPPNTLRHLPGFNLVVAERFADFRAAHGTFTSLDSIIHAPLIAAARFEQFVGRPSLHVSHPLHAALGWPYETAIYLRDLQPLAAPPAPLVRVVLGREDSLRTEREFAQLRNLHLTCQRIAGLVLFFHQRPLVGLRRPALFATLPRALRPLLVRLALPPQASPQ
jgi:hypothetical protein